MMLWLVTLSSALTLSRALADVQLEPPKAPAAPPPPAAEGRAVNPMEAA